MSLRLRCRSCQAAFVTSKDQVGQSVECPKCGAPQVVPKPKPAADAGEHVESGPALQRIKATAPAPAAKSSVFIKKDKSKSQKNEPKPANKGLWAALLLLPVIVIAIVVAWPKVDPRPTTPVEAAAYDYLMALKADDQQEIAKLGVVEDPPLIRSFRDLKRDKPRDVQIKSDFKPIAALHRAIEKKFVYDPKSGRFQLKDPLGAAAETLDALHDAKDKAEKNKTYEKMASGDPNESMDASIEFFGDFAKLSEGLLHPKNLVPTYKKLVQNAKPPLTGDELALAMDYANHRESWDRMLKRPFPTIKTNSPYLYQKADFTVQVQDRLGSSGGPPVTLRLKLVNFVMDGIDTRWKVVSARRITPGAPDLPEDDNDPEPEISPQPAKPSPGDLPASPGLNLEGLPVDIPKVDLPK